MAEKYYSILTNRGKALEAAASVSGVTVVLKDFVIGDGNGVAVTPDPASTSLIREVYRSAISSLEISPDQDNQFIAHLVIPANVGGFTVREVGLLTDAGELYAVSNSPAIEKPESGINVNLQFRLAVSETANIELKVATGDGLFLRQDANLSDVKDKVSSRKNLGLGKLAVKDSLTAADVGALTQSDGDARYVNADGDTMNGDLSTPNLTAGTVTATNGTMAIRATFDGTNQYARLFLLDADAKIVLANIEADFSRNLVFNINGRRFVMDRNGNMFVPGGVYDSGQRVYSPNYRPTAEAVGALPIGGGTLGGPLLVKGQISTDEGYNVYASQDVIAGNGGVYEGGKRVYSPNNPQPIPAKSVASLGNSGWERNIDTGLIRQWGSFVSGSANIESRGFPIAFPTTAVGVYANIGVNGAGNIYVEQDGATSFKSKTTLAGAGVYWEAVGY